MPPRLFGPAAAALLTVVALAPAAHAQRPLRRPPGGALADQVPVTVALNVAGSSRKASGPGRCTHTAAGYIYGTPAAMWSVQFTPSGNARESLTLTVWRPKSGGAAQFGLDVNGAASHRISTVKGAPVVGSGTVTVTTHGPGATFAIDGKSDDGAAIRGTVDCARLTAAVAEGG